MSSKYYNRSCLMGLTETIKRHNNDGRCPDRDFSQARIIFVIRESIKSYKSERHHQIRRRRMENTSRNSHTSLRIVWL